MTTLTEPPTGGQPEDIGPAQTGAPDPAAAARQEARARPAAPAAADTQPPAQSTWADPVPWVAAAGTITIGLWAATGGAASLFGGGVDTMLGISRLSGLVAGLAALFGLILTARPRWMERAAGLDRMISWHRVTGMSAAFAMLMHVPASALAAGGGLSSAWTGLVDLVTGTDWFMAALVAAVLFTVVSLTSWRRIRSRMSYETWHIVHLAGYLAVALALPHALFSGSTLNGNLVARWWWIGLYVLTATIILVSRVGGILGSVLRPRTTISRIVQESPDVGSLIIAGPGVDRLGAKPGQFVTLRILTRDLWWQAHPYSLSAASRPSRLRLTVKILGDGSRQTMLVPPGTRVLLEGPYGVMTMDQTAGRPVLMIGIGVGLAPMRALLEAAEPSQEPLVLARAHSREDLLLARELDALARERGGALVPVTGPRTDFPGNNPFSVAALRANVPDLGARSAFVCGPQALQKRVCRELERAGVSREHIHAERSAW